MKTVAVIPIKSNSERVKSKNFRLINSSPLYTYILQTASKANFDEIYVDTDSEEIKDYGRGLGYKIIDRLPELAKNTANGNDLIIYHQKIIEADCFFQLFATAPLILHGTINQCIDIMKEGFYDSILTAEEIYSWFWFDGQPVNYDPKVLPRSQDAKPIVRETTGLYGITSVAIEKFHSRIGRNPYFYMLKDNQKIDLDTEEDFLFLEFLMGKC